MQKNHLINLLFEEYKQLDFYNTLYMKGINEIDNVVLLDNVVNNLDVVLDIIGFPKDNSEANTTSTTTEDKINNNYDLFNRDYLHQAFSEINSNTSSTKSNDKDIIKLQISDYIDWLFKEQQNLEVQ